MVYALRLHSRAWVAISRHGSKEDWRGGWRALHWCADLTDAEKFGDPDEAARWGVTALGHDRFQVVPIIGSLPTTTGPGTPIAVRRAA
ncbi:hypothetical protein K32_24140 [Kaistia sp. 32K]|uniref:hypothetical protein n=1 Tax=Kaistia sp. 32K TaxID=2795690 RepID=UPI0019169684|nr:hypothetical protein [Kaistia sp. 32K]BCP53797.1 hypothetical protein K32_24140 [Kaistia sp. 32K]